MIWLLVLLLSVPTLNTKLIDSVEDAKPDIAEGDKRALLMTKARVLCQGNLISILHSGEWRTLFMELATAVGVAQRLNTVLVQKHVVALVTEGANNITRIFDGVKERTLFQEMESRTVLIDDTEMSCADIVTDPDAIAENMSKKWEAAFYYPRLAAKNKTLVVSTPEGFAPAVAAASQELRSEMVFAPYLLDPAAKKIRVLVDDVKRSSKLRKPDKVLVVGIDARHDEDITEAFFINALHWMIYTLRTKDRPREYLSVKQLPLHLTSLNATLRKLHPKHVEPLPPHQFPFTPLIAVAVVGDDLPWVNKILVPALRTYSARERVKGLQIVGVGSDDPEENLALLALCNHTIISQGAYGATGAIFSGGRTVVYNAKNPNNIAESLAKFFPLWVLME